MRIAVVSRSWPSNDRSGVTLAAAEHVRMLASAGASVSIIGAHEAVCREDLPAARRSWVPASGSGSLYSPARIDKNRLAEALRETVADLVVVEAWQTALTDSAVEVSASLGLATLMISHGSSLHPFSRHPVDRLRALAWLPYRQRTLPRLLSHVSVLTTLDETATSSRFYDRDLARTLGVPVLPLTNAPVNWSQRFLERPHRNHRILVVGYFSPVKNQLGALDVAAALPPPFRLSFIGPRQGSYFKRCVRRASQLGLHDRVDFLEDHECDIAEEMSRSLLVLSTSITEALPLTLIEAMASGTPFVATPVGAVPSLVAGGVLAPTPSAQAAAILALARDHAMWQQHSEGGRKRVAQQYSNHHVRSQLLAAIEFAMKKGPRVGPVVAGVSRHAAASRCATDRGIARWS